MAPGGIWWHPMLYKAKILMEEKGGLNVIITTYLTLHLVPPRGTLAYLSTTNSSEWA